MGDGEAGDWQRDLRPARRTPRNGLPIDAARPRPATDGAGTMDIVAALADLRRSVDRLGLRISDIERVLLIASENGAAEDWSAAVQRVRADLSRPRPLGSSSERRTRAKKDTRSSAVDRASDD